MTKQDKQRAKRAAMIKALARKWLAEMDRAMHEIEINISLEN